MRIATWNVNSVRLRMPLLERMTARLDPDVVCLQETKVADELFPLDAVRALGYPHIAISGMKSYNGVAIASKFPLSDIRKPHWCGREDCRHLAAMIEGIDVHCLYVPAGGDIPDPEANPKFAHKLDFLDALTGYFAETGDPKRPMMLLGDLNIAPLETDVWSHKQLLDVVSHTPVEVAKLTEFQQTLPWVDAVRHFVPPTERLYSWWSYRASDWAKSNKGRRLDHIWATPSLADRLASATVLAEARGWNTPSDHVPVAVDLND